MIDRMHPLFVLLCAGLVVSSAHGATMVSLRPSAPTTRPSAFDRMEWTIDIDSTYQNPFDPDEVAVDCLFTSPAGRTLIVPAFWDDSWKLRFCPSEPGTWQLTINVKDRSGAVRSQPHSFTIEPSTSNGFIRRGNSRYFQFDSGRPFFMIGVSLCWPTRRGIADYEQWFPRLRDVGGNFTRIWMSSPNRPTETKQAGLGRYDLRAMAFYDQIFDLASRNGIYCMLALGTYGDFMEGGHFGEGRWGGSPYNAANGGPATRPADLFTMPQVRKLYKQRLRYLIARYSAYTSLAFWEFWNEQDNGKVDVPADWVREMARYIRAHDPHQHLITTSFANRGPADVWSIPEIDLTQRHIYGDEESLFDAVPTIVTSTLGHLVHPKPHLLGEYGISWRGPDAQYDPKGIGTNFHNSIWAAVFSGGAGTALNWWWESYIFPKNVYTQFAPLARFCSQIDWPRRDFRPLKLRTPTFNTTPMPAYRDLRFPASTTWGKPDYSPRTIEEDGTISADLPGFLFGPVKSEWRGTLKLNINLPQPSKMIIRILKVCDQANLRIWIDDKPIVDFPFSALPGAADQEKTELRDDKKTYQAIFNKDRIVEIPAGNHTISLANTGGDWLSIGSIRFTDAISSRYTGLRPIGLIDDASGEILVWIHDPDSHVGSDRAGLQPRTFENATLSIPVSKSSSYTIQWWDTRTGQVLRTDSISPSSGQLLLPIPTFTRDVALRATTSSIP